MVVEGPGADMFVACFCGPSQFNVQTGVLSLFENALGFVVILIDFATPRLLQLRLSCKIARNHADITQQFDMYVAAKQRFEEMFQE
ncbi:hypothetical protein PF1751_v1c48670 [Pseudomonas simiae]|nr:hypothetical protein PF1751_v1c48670 [Pseudomonas simiae]